MSELSLSLVSHTNVGKTTLARTLLGRDIGEVRDATHVTELADAHLLVESAAGDRLRLWDTPGFGDSVRLARRMRRQGQPLGWLLSEVWDRWRDRPFWASQQALRHVRDDSDVVLYLVNAAEAPAAAGYVAPEMELLAWVGKPVIVLLNQLGAARTAAEDAADIEAWRAHLAPHPLVKAVLPLDAFSRCWLQEGLLLGQIAAVLAGEPALAMQRLHAAWAHQRLATFDHSIALLATGLGSAAAARVTVADGAGVRGRLRQLGGALGLPGAEREAEPQQIAQQELAAALAEASRTDTTRLIALHGLDGQAQADIEALLDQPFDHRQKLPEGRAAVLGGAVTGALAGLKADVLSGGLTLGGGLIAGGLIGALGAASLARGINVVRGTGSSWVAWNAEALDALAEAALMRYLAVAHFGRGRGAWVRGEPPAHWRSAVQQALSTQAGALATVWRGRSTRHDTGDDATVLARELRPLLHAATRDALERLYPGAWPRAGEPAGLGDPPQSPS
jgi:hypothetical protein